MRCSKWLGIALLFVLSEAPLHASSTSLEDLFDEKIGRIQFEMRFFDLLECVGNSNADFTVTLKSLDDLDVVKKAKPVGVKGWNVDEDGNVITSSWRYYHQGSIEKHAEIVLSRKKKSSSLEEKD